MSFVTQTVKAAKIAPLSGQSLFSLFALLLSFGLVLLGLFSAEYSRPDAATGDPFLFFLQP